MTVLPDINPASGSDGHIQSYDGTGFAVGPGTNPTAFANARAGTNKAALAATSCYAVCCDGGSYGADPNVYNYRGFLPFSLDSFPGGIITAAVLSLWILSKTIVDGGQGTTLAVVSSTQASLSALATSDFSLVGSTQFAATPPSVAGVTTGQYLDIALNASGIAALQAGSGKLALLNSLDLAAGNGPTSGNPFGGSQPADYLMFEPSSVGTHKPKLSITYTPQAGGAMRQRPSKLWAPSRFVR